jgi:phage terminase large subunit-like protein
MIPRTKIIPDTIIKKTGTPMAIDIIEIKHISGGISTIQFFSYEMDREKFQGSSVDLIWFDEEPPEEIYNECKMRVLDCQGNIMFTFTPLSGMTPFYDNIMQDEKILKVFLSMDNAKHLKKEDIERLLEGMSDSEKKARRHGVATIGSGKIFNFAEEEYTIEPFEIPAHWRRLGGLDVGLTHPTGAVMAAYDDDSKTVYITNEYRVQNKTAIDHSAHLKHWGVKFMTDPSAFSRQIGSGVSTASIYEDEGLDLKRANNDVDAGISEMRRLIGSGRLYIFSTCQMLLKELRTYRTKETSDGKSKIVKTNDDLVDTCRYTCIDIDANAELPKRFRKKPSIKVFKPADKKVAY